MTQHFRPKVHNQYQLALFMSRVVERRKKVWQWRCLVATHIWWMWKGSNLADEVLLQVLHRSGNLFQVISRLVTCIMYNSRTCVR